ncbi:MAG: glutaredoxin family protein [Deltaproteobacteria bacterium]|nr:glutaredoxin family protein [Deltaproteobacteria bacterium]
MSRHPRPAALLAALALALPFAGCGAGGDHAIREPGRAEEGAGGDAVGEVLGAVSRAVGVEQADPPDAGPGYWRYTEPSGSVRFVQSLAEVPASARAGAEHIATGAPRPAAARRTAAAPARSLRPRRPAPEEPARHADAAVVVYTTSWCGWCRKTLAWLDERGVDYENRDIERNPEWAAELERKTGGQSIPVVDVGGRLVRGFDPGTLEELL